MTSDAVVWVVIAGAAVGTYALRLSFIELLGFVDEVPPLLERALAFVPAAVLAALVLPDLLSAGGPPLSAGYERLVAGGLAAAVAWKTEDMLATITVGMVALWLLTWFA